MTHCDVVVEAEEEQKEENEDDEDEYEMKMFSSAHYFVLMCVLFCLATVFHIHIDARLPCDATM